MKTKLQKYPAYKDSGVEWLGEIPSHWECMKLKLISSIFNGDSLNEKEKSDYQSDDSSYLPYISTKDVNFEFSRIEYETGLSIPSKQNKLKVAPRGSFVLCIEGGSAGKKIGYLEKDVCFVNKLACFNVSKKYSSKYYFYFAKSKSFQTQFNLSMTGLIGGVSISLIKNFDTYLPSFSEQTAIATYLDDKTVKIDQAIFIKQKQIELLKERRQILIHKAVTCGLNPKVKLKDSGVEWIGEVPEGWEVVKIKHISSKIGSGVTPSGGGTTYLDSGIPLLRSQNILLGKIELEGVAYISDKVHASMSNSQVRKGDVLLNITGGSIGRCHYVDFDAELNVNQHVCIVRPTEKITTLFLNSILSSEIGQGQIWFNQQGGGREGLNFQSIKNFSLPLPPIFEQKSICNFIEQLTNKFVAAINLKGQEIDKLKEYKASLINSAVTGKIKVV